MIRLMSLITNSGQYYDHPAVPNLFSNFTTWFEFLKGQKLRTYFNVTFRDASDYELLNVTR